MFQKSKSYCPMKITLKNNEMQKFKIDFSDIIPYFDYDNDSLKVKKCEFEDENNELYIIVDFEVNVTMKHSTGDYYTPAESWVSNISVNVWNWEITTTEGDEVELDPLGNARLELALIDVIKDAYR